MALAIEMNFDIAKQSEFGDNTHIQTSNLVLLATRGQMPLGSGKDNESLAKPPYTLQC